MVLPISSRNSASKIIQDPSRGETEGHVRYAPRDESASAAVLQTYELESFRHSAMRGMPLPISSRNSASNIIQDTSRRETEGHVRYAPRDESASAAALQTYGLESFRHSTMRGMPLPISSRNSASNIIQDTSRGETEGHVRYVPSDESPLTVALLTYQLESFRHSTMRGMALPISSRNSTSNTIQDTSRGETQGDVQCAPSDESALAAALRISLSESFRHSTMRGMPLPISSRNSASTTIQDTSRGETEIHVRYAPRDESASAAALRSYELETFRHSTMLGMPLPISSRNSASNIIQDTSRGETKIHVRYAPRDESALAVALRSYELESFRYSIMRGMVLPISFRNSASNIIQDTSRGETEGHVRYAPSDESTLTAALRSSEFEPFRHSTMRGVALPISS